jgi:glycosyltransferase involved in cell wall biosynthesis
VSYSFIERWVEIPRAFVAAKSAHVPDRSAVNVYDVCMNILHITTFLQGGAGRVIADLACSQALSGHSVAVATSGNGSQDYGNYPEWLDRLRLAGVHCIMVESTFTRDVSLNVAAFHQIGQNINCNSLSLIHTHAAIPSMVALLLRAKARQAVPILQTMHGWGIRKDPRQEATDIILMNQLDRVVATSDSSKHLLIRLGLASELIDVVQNGIAPSASSANEEKTRRLRHWRSVGLKVLVCIGTVGKRKNQRMLLEALAHPDAPRNIACAIVGEGEDVPALTAWTRETGIENRVHFFGYQPGGEQFVANADWLVLPSNDEGLPISILEAYAAGIPVLGSDIPEIAEIIQPGHNGILFGAGNVESLVQALKQLANMPEDQRLRMGLASKQLWQERFSLHCMQERYARIYADLLAGHCRGSKSEL